MQRRLDMDENSFGLIYNYNLKTHAKKDLDQTPYVCDICFTAFSDLSKLRIHMMTHGREKSFECYYCPSDFSEENELIEHTKLHTRENQIS